MSQTSLFDGYLIFKKTHVMYEKQKIEENIIPFKLFYNILIIMQDLETKFRYMLFFLPTIILFNHKRDRI